MKRIDFLKGTLALGAFQVLGCSDDDGSADDVGLGRPDVPAVDAPAADTTADTTARTDTGSADGGNDTMESPDVAAPSTLWVQPSQTGPRIGEGSMVDLAPFATDDLGITINSAFIAAHQGEPWLTEEGGIALITGVKSLNRGLNFTVPIILRDSIVKSGSRDQPTWTNTDVDDAACIVLDEPNSIVEYCLIEGIGDDGSANINGTAIGANGQGIVSRGVRFEGDGCVVRYCDISGVRGAFQGFTDCVAEYNYCHSFTYGLDPNRVGRTAPSGNPDEVTHSNAFNNQGYRNWVVRYNYTVARYTTVSTHPPGGSPESLSPYSWNGMYPNRVVSVGDPIDGFTFTNYLSGAGRDGQGWLVHDNYTEGTFRPARVNTSSAHASPLAGSDVSRNVFADHALSFSSGIVRFDDKDRAATWSGSCNQEVDSDGVVTFMPATAFSSNNHGTTDCSG